jgi:hypothetical protein
MALFVYWEFMSFTPVLIRIMFRTLHSADHRSREGRQLSVFLYVFQINFLQYKTMACKSLAQ